MPCLAEFPKQNSHALRLCALRARGGPKLLHDRQFRKIMARILISRSDCSEIFRLACFEPPPNDAGEQLHPPGAFEGDHELRIRRCDGLGVLNVVPGILFEFGVFEVLWSDVPFVEPGERTPVAIMRTFCEIDGELDPER